MVLKTRKQVDKSAMMKIWSELRQGLSICVGQFSVSALLTPEHVINCLAYVWKEFTAVKGTRFERGIYGATKTQNKEIRKMSALTLIRDKGPTEAKYLWACMGRKSKEFAEAVAEFDWTNQAFEEKRLQDEADKLFTCLYPWQERIMQLFIGPIHKRNIYVILDEEVGSGKSALQKAMAARFRNKVLTMANGKSTDMAYIAKNGGRYSCVQMNVARMQTSTLNLGFLEQLKDGLYCNMKYKGSLVEKETPHVFMYTNTEPVWEDLTVDRWQIIHLSKEYNNHFREYDWKTWTSRMNKKMAEEDEKVDLTCLERMPAAEDSD